MRHGWTVELCKGTISALRRAKGATLVIYGNCAKATREAHQETCAKPSQLKANVALFPLGERVVS